MEHNSNLASVMTSLDKARGLPNGHYTDPTVFEEEKKALLFHHWCGIGFAHDVPDVGDAKPVEFLGMPLLIVRDKTGEIGVFQNTCRHRGMILVSKPTKIRGAIRCPYHSWCYALNGDLRSTPHVGGPGHNKHEAIDMSKLGLVRIRAYVWHGVIFANIDGKAPDFEEVHGKLLARWQEFEQPLYSGGAVSTFTLNVKANWKLAVENYCESYHLPWIHPGLNSYSRLEDHYNIDEPNNYAGQGTEVYRQLKDDKDGTLPDFMNLSEKWNEGGEYIAVYPNVLLGVQRDHTFSIILEPADYERTVEHIALFYATNTDETPELDGLREANAKLWKSVFEEDIFVVEGMQKGRYGILFDGGRFSPVMDAPTHNFHHWVATQISEWRGYG